MTSRMTGPMTGPMTGMTEKTFGLRTTGRAGDPRLARRLAGAVSGEVLFDPFSRGRYSTDASHYQIEPIGVVIPRHSEDVAAVLDVAREEGVPVLPRGAGTSQCGQTVSEAIAVDTTRHMNRLLSVDTEARTARVEPGIVLDALNRQLHSLGLWFPVDVSTAAQATLGGMAGNNSCGSRSLRYGTMRDNVRSLEAFLANGERMHFGPVTDHATMAGLGQTPAKVMETVLGIGRRHQTLVADRFPDLMRRVGGYNLDALLPGGAGHGPWRDRIAHPRGGHPNLAHLLVGSEGTLAFSTEIELELQPLPRHKLLGICHFPRFYDAMDATRRIVELGPVAVELVDRKMIDLARQIPLFRETLQQFVRGEPDALLLVEFAEPEDEENRHRLAALGGLMAKLGFPDSVLEASDPGFQKAIWDVRKAGLNIMMSMKGAGKPVSFIEDCAVRLEDLAEYTRRLTEVFRANGTEGTWYAHASVGCLHVRPVLNLKTELGAKQLRTVAEKAFALVREYKGSHSGEHGDGLVRSEFHEAMFGSEMTAAFREVKEAFDPDGLFNPGKIVDPPRMNDRSLFRFKPDYAPIPLETGLDWSEWGGYSEAVEMCNNNGTCRRSGPGVMCPSFRISGAERDLTRGRANSLRLALSGQLGPGAFTSEAMAETMALCVGCKGCKRECPTVVDMAKMKIEYLHQRRLRQGVGLRGRIVAHLPRYAPVASRLRWLLHARDQIPGASWLSERLVRLAARRSLPHWAAKPYRPSPGDRQGGRLPRSGEGEANVVLLADTFNTWFEPENLRAAERVLEAAGLAIISPAPLDAPLGGSRPLCCGRTYLAAGMIPEARREARRMLEALVPYARQGIPIVGLEPSCLLTLRDEFLSLGLGPTAREVAEHARLFEELLDEILARDATRLTFTPQPERAVLLHGHCHQKAFAAMAPVERLLARVPGLEVTTVESSCCGMAGAFGYEAEHFDASMAMAELALLPAARAAGDRAWIVADGTSCRHQLADGAGREAFHAARILARCLPGGDGEVARPAREPVSIGKEARR